MDTPSLIRVLTILEKESHSWQAPIVTYMAQTHGTAFRVLVSTLLSLRTKDETTGPAALRLFSRAETPQQMLQLSEQEIRDLIYPVGFYKVKAGRLRQIAAILLDSYQGLVPDSLEELLKLPGVGRKTANLVLILGHQKPGICVDVHVHRISNRWDYVQTRSPDDTEMQLRAKLPGEWWMRYNDLLVAFGQSICKPVSPLCSSCPVADFCPRRGVTKSR